MKNSLRSIAAAVSVVACIAVGAAPASATTVNLGAPSVGPQVLKGGATPDALLPDDFLCKLFRSC